MTLTKEKAGLHMRVPTHSWQCPYCRRPVGIIGNWLAVAFGAQFHGCDFSNVMSPSEWRKSYLSTDEAA